ncbi:MAG: 16S rRNA (cytidine(1402)-2'-O)-methyltransferase [Syntrophobacteraceae bacterium]|jgi:16S rRNA (cytidine1402-2'-O)-methyltransferase
MPLNPDAEKRKEGRLYIVSTPIGNLADITLRALDTLRAVDLIAAEDTRHTRKLLSYYGIHKPLISYHEHNAMQRGGELIEKIASGLSVALVTDAGTPGVSDPGRFLIDSALQRGVEPIPIPGPTAVIPALIVSGLSPQPFVFLGFPPVKGAERRKFFEKNACLAMTLILYESPGRLVKTLKDMLGNWGERRVAVARELTKIHEEIFRGSISEAIDHFTGKVRGELTVVVEGAGPGLNNSKCCPDPESSNPSVWKDELKNLLSQGLSSKETASTIAARFNIPRRMVYQAALEIKRGQTRPPLEKL